MSASTTPVQASTAHEQRLLEESITQTTRGQNHDRISTVENEEASTGGNGEITVTQRMVSATWGSLLTSLLVTPLDVVRVRLQSQNPTPTLSALNQSRFAGYTTNFEKLPHDLGVKACCREVFWVGDNGQFCLAGNGSTTASGVATDCAVEETERRTINSTLDGLKKIARNEGPLTLWRGLTPTLAMAIPANVIYFTGYDWLRYNSASPVTKFANDRYNPLISGSFARVLSAIAVSPIEMFRTRMQSSSSSTTSVFMDTLRGMREMTHSQGYTSLWRGLTLTMWRDVPFSAIYWWGYEAVRDEFKAARQRNSGGTLLPHNESHTTTFVDSFAAGTISGGIAALVTTPFDVGKTRQQVFRHAGDDGPTTRVARDAMKAGQVVPEELSMPRFLYHILKEEGMSGLFKGWAARCLKVAPACAIMISSYELGKKWAKRTNVRKEEKAQGL